MPSLVEQITTLAQRIGLEIKSVRAAKADDVSVVHTSGTETIGGAKTFSSPPSVPVGNMLAHPVRRDDTRLSDARTPNAHKTSHATGGSDALAASDIGAAATSHVHSGSDVTTGTVAYARLPVGTASSTIAAGNDTRFTNARAWSLYGGSASTGQVPTWNGTTFAPATPASGGPSGWFDVKAYGAIGDGTTDDTAAIQAAISASTTGSVVWFPGGTYRVTSCIQLAGSRAYLGAGGRAQLTNIKADTGVVGAVMAPVGWYNNQDSVPSIYMHGILLDCNAIAGIHGLVVYNFWSSFIDIQVRYCNAGNSFHVTHLARDGVTSTTSSCSENEFAGIRAYGGTGNSSCFRVYSNNNAANQDGHLLGSYFTGNATSGGNYGNGILIDRAGGWTIENNHTYDIGLDAIKCYNGYGTKIIGNYVEDEGLANASGAYYNGIALQQLDGRASVVANNTVSITQPVGATTVNAARWTGIYVGTQSSAETRAMVVETGNSVVYANSTAPTTNRSWAYDLSRTGTASLFVTYAANQIDGTIGYQTIRNVSSGVTVTEPGAVDLSAYATTASLAGYVPTSRALTAGTGLTGGGALTADRTLAVSYGTSAGTAAQGNDSRLSDARTPTTHAASHRSGGSDAIAPAPRSQTGAATTTIAAVSGVDLDRVDVTTSVNITSLTLSGGFNGQQVRVSVLASSGTRAVTVASAVDTSTGLTRGPYSITSGQLGKFLFEYSSLNTEWALLAATVTSA